MSKDKTVTVKPNKKKLILQKLKEYAENGAPMNSDTLEQIRNEVEKEIGSCSIRYVQQLFKAHRNKLESNVSAIIREGKIAKTFDEELKEAEKLFSGVEDTPLTEMNLTPLVETMLPTEETEEKKPTKKGEIVEKPTVSPKEVAGFVDGLDILIAQYLPPALSKEEKVTLVRAWYPVFVKMLPTWGITETALMFTATVFGGRVLNKLKDVKKKQKEQKESGETGGEADYSEFAK